MRGAVHPIGHVLPLGPAKLDEIGFEGACLVRAESPRDLLELVEREIQMIESLIALASRRIRLQSHPGHRRYRPGPRRHLRGRDR